MKILPSKLLILIFMLGIFSPSQFVFASVVLSTHKYAWSNNIGYINFQNVTVSDGSLGGYAWSANKGWINFSPAKGGVSNDGTGNLSGFAWGEQLGWIDFDGVSINGSTGQFSGIATNPLVGTINFNCPNYCDVQTDWRQAAAASNIVSVAGVSHGDSGGPILGSLSNLVVIPIISNKLPQQNLLLAQGPAVGLANAQGIAGGLEPAPLFDVIAEPVSSQQADGKGTRVDTSNAGLIVKVAPGEILPISVKLSNFGGRKRVDVLVKYSIFSKSGEEVYTTNETVAVETTANFIKTIQIPFGLASGIYTAQTSIIYEGQLVPATTQFPFTVERKILGIFQSDFMLYGGLMFFVSVLLGLMASVFVKRRRLTRSTPLDYSDIPHDERVFFELLSDTIMEMRERVGDQALEIARQIDGLVIDEKTGRVLKLSGSPPKIIAELVTGYEKVLGKKVSFSFRK